MITDIPTQNDFRNSAIDFLHLAWDNIWQLNHTFYLADDCNALDPDSEEIYWKSAQKKLLITLTLTQQSNEFFLKGNIASVSPFLLINNDHKYWPKGCNIKDTPFSAFKTLDATDLIKVHNTVFYKRATNDFEERFNKLRHLRNSIMHTVDPALQTNIVFVCKAILESFCIFSDGQTWLKSRKEYLEDRHPDAIIYIDDVNFQVYLEATYAMAIMSKAEIMKYFGITKARRYICPNCNDSTFRDNNVNADLVQLSPNTSSSTTAICLLCGETIEVIRSKCKHCKSNVISKEFGLCLNCFEDISEDNQIV